LVAFGLGDVGISRIRAEAGPTSAQNVEPLQMIVDYG
jgi:hypothetical protein